MRYRVTIELHRVEPAYIDNILEHDIHNILSHLKPQVIRTVLFSLVIHGFYERNMK